MGRAGMTALDDDPLNALRERIRATAEAADRLAGEAGAADREGPPRTDEAAHEAQALVALVALLRDLLPDDLRRQVMDLVRQVLRLVRAIIDWYLVRLEDPAGTSPTRAPAVEDIPLD
ncbi:MAG: hypothetical protein QOG68_2518 [Solirubrobacteraceae bacterium]|nr:hypothetical protein [Solirubrobacteraceae bacterium]